MGKRTFSRRADGDQTADDEGLSTLRLQRFSFQADECTTAKSHADKEFGEIIEKPLKRIQETSSKWPSEVREAADAAYVPAPPAPAQVMPRNSHARKNKPGLKQLLYRLRAFSAKLALIGGNKYNLPPVSTAKSTTDPLRPVTQWSSLLNVTSFEYERIEREKSTSLTVHRDRPPDVSFAVARLPAPVMSATLVPQVHLEIVPTSSPVAGLPLKYSPYLIQSTSNCFILYPLRASERNIRKFGHPKYLVAKAPLGVQEQQPEVYDCYNYDIIDLLEATVPSHLVPQASSIHPEAPYIAPLVSAPLDPTTLTDWSAVHSADYPPTVAYSQRELATPEPSPLVWEVPLPEQYGPPQMLNRPRNPEYHPQLRYG
ncbi:hypothetical protein P7C70_g7593, partial [Phenoliferia sp. Uapishka_3]